LMQAIDQAVRKLREHADIQLDSQALSKLEIGGRFEPDAEATPAHAGH